MRPCSLRGMRIALALTLLILAAACGTAPAEAGIALHSPNWSGYVAVACPACHLRYVAASWTVPAVNCAASPPIAQAESWVGLDGWGSGTLEQAGTDSSCTDGRAAYYAWYQMYPAQPVVWYGPGRLSYDVNAGDQIRASVYYDATSGRWQLTVDDRTSGLAVTTSQPCPPGMHCGNADAEVIMEAPNLGANVPLADFGTVTYTGISVTSRDGTRGTMASNGLWTVRPVGLLGATGTMLATPGPVRGTAFTDTWNAAQLPRPLRAAPEVGPQLVKDGVIVLVVGPARVGLRVARRRFVRGELPERRAEFLLKDHAGRPLRCLFGLLGDEHRVRLRTGLRVTRPEVAAAHDQRERDQAAHGLQGARSPGQSAACRRR